MLTRNEDKHPPRAQMAIWFADLSSFSEASVDHNPYTRKPIRCYWSVITRFIEFRGSKLSRHGVYFFGVDGWEQDALVARHLVEFAHILRPAVQRISAQLRRGC